MRHLLVILALLSLTACASLPLESQWLDQLAKEAGDRGEIVTATSAIAILRMPAWAVGERALTCQIPTGEEREKFKAGIADRVFAWHMKEMEEAGLSVLISAVSVAHPESVSAWVELINVAVEAELIAAERYADFECGKK